MEKKGLKLKEKKIHIEIATKPNKIKHIENLNFKYLRF